jgi:hypothetical protein
MKDLVKKILREYSEKNKITIFIQNSLNNDLKKIKDDLEISFGDRERIEQFESVEHIIVKDVILDESPKVIVDIVKNNNIYDFDYVLSFLEYKLNRIIPGVEVILNNVQDSRKFGPGIDW